MEATGEAWVNYTFVIKMTNGSNSQLMRIYKLLNNQHGIYRN